MRCTLLSLLPAFFATAALRAQPSVTVTFFDFTGLPARTLQQARTEATRIFLQAGIRLDWIVCETAGQPLNPPGCSVPLGADRFMLQFIPGSNSTNRRAAGMAPIHQPLSVYACVYPERVRDLSSEANWEFADLLGHAVAHELGHLLLNSSRHSNAGIMRARWESQDLRMLSHNGLVFLAGQLGGAQARLDPQRPEQELRQATSDALNALEHVIEARN